MKKIIVYGFFGLLLTSCVSPTKPLYYWGNYQERTYSYAKNETDKSLDELLNAYQLIIEKQNKPKKTVNNQYGSRSTVPPGICADYGYLLYKKGKTKEGLELLEKEIVLYPESFVFISQIIKKLQNENK
jgi:hypothetical protein